MQKYTVSSIKALLPNTPLEFYNTIDSSNRVAKVAAVNGAVHGALFVAQSQSAGKGRQSRLFQSPPGGIYMSIVLRPQNKNKTYPAGLITAGAAVAVHEAVESVCGITLSIKWVNDLLWQNKKCCGILTEAGWVGNLPPYYIVGIGLNYTADINNATFKESSALGAIAGVLFETGKEPVPHATLLAEIYNRVLNIFNTLPNKDFLDIYRANCFMLGKDITVMANKPYLATAKAIDNEAQLIVTLPNGDILTLNSGEVSVSM